MATAQGATNLPFAEQIDFFRQKLNLPSERWDSIRKAAHDRAFIVAGAMKADLVADLRGAVAKAIEQGTTLETFRKDFKEVVRKHGWTGWTGEGTKAGEAWRTRVIFETNLRTSHAAGRWAQLNDPDLLALRPYWRYVHNDSALHPRPHHQAWGNRRLTLRHDHPFWQTHYPPNGWGCRCRVVAVKGPGEGDEAAPPEGWDTVLEQTGAPPGIDRGWGYAPGASAATSMQAFIDRKLIDLDGDIGQAMMRELAPVLGRGAAPRVFEAQRTVKDAARWAVSNGLADFADYAGVKVEVANAWNRSLFDHLVEFPELRKNQKFVGTCQAQFSRWREIEVARLADRLRQANPQLPEDFDFRGRAEGYVKAKKVSGSTWAHSWDQRDVSGIAVNSKWGNDLTSFQDALKGNVENGWHPPGCDTIRSVVDHELAHQLDSLLRLAVDPEVVLAYKEAMSRGIGTEVSYYAKTNIKEFIAECWAEALNSERPREFARRIADIVRSRYADQYPRA